MRLLSGTRKIDRLNNRRRKIEGDERTLFAAVMKIQAEKTLIHSLPLSFLKVLSFNYNITMLCYVMLCYVMLCHVMSCYAMLCYVMLCYVMDVCIDACMYVCSTCLFAPKT